MIKKWITAVVALLVAFPVVGGEIIGNTYIGEKHGYIEINSPDGKWQIQDREGQGTQIAQLALKDQISGSRPTVLFSAIPKGAGITADQVLQWSREAMEKQGMELGQIEPVRFGGKQVYGFQATLTKGTVKVEQRNYLIEGAKSYFLVSCTALSAAFNAAKPLFEEVMEKLKY